MRPVGKTGSHGRLRAGWTPRGALLAALAALLVGCGGDPSPQEAEDHVRETLEATGENVVVPSVFCEEIDGERFECEVERRIEGLGEAGHEVSRAVVEFDEIE